MKKLILILATLLSVNLFSQTDYYYNGSGSFTNTNSWDTDPSGVGINPPADFIDGDIDGINDFYHIANTTAAALNANWDLGGEAFVADGVNFTVGGALVITGGLLDFGGTGTGTITISTTATVANPAKLVGVLSGGLVIHNTTRAVTGASYFNLIIAANASLGGTTRVNNNLTINATITLGLATRSITVSGDINCIGLINGHAQASLILNGTASSSLKFGTTMVLRNLTINPSVGSTFILGTALTCSNSAISLFSINNAILDITGQLLTVNSRTVTLGASAYLRSSSTSSLSFGGPNVDALTGGLQFDPTSAATRSLFDLTMNRTGQTLAIGNTLEIINSITPTLGTIASFGTVTLIASSTRSGRIGIVGGAITGNVIVQTYAASAGTTGWTNIASSGIAGLTVANWQTQFPLTCNGCITSTTSAGAFASMQGGNEAGTGGTEYTVVSNTTPLAIGTGFWVFLGTGLTTTSPILITETGSAAQGNVGVGLTKTGSGQNGYNLIANPYASPISWTAAAASNSMIDGTAYMYSPVGGQITVSGAGVSTPSGYIVNGVIPMGQGLYVFANSAGTFNFAESHKSTANTSANPLLKTNGTNSNASSTYAEFRLGITDPYGTYDETVIIADDNATPNFDNMLDAIKKFQTPGYSGTGAVYTQYTSINSLSNNTDYAINSLPLTQNLIIPIRAKAMVSGTYTINPLQIQNLPAGACIILKDKLLNINHDLRLGSYVFTMADTTSVPRFELRITINPLGVTSTISQPICSNPNAGQILAVGNNSGPWNYYWKDVNGTPIKTSLNKTTADTLSNLTGGNYLLDINTVGQCDNHDSTFTISTIVLVSAQFTSIDTLNLSGGTTTISFNNTSTNAINNFWNFGDGFGVSSNVNPTYNYLAVGIYTVSLIATSNSNCLDTAYKTIVVINNITTGLMSQNALGSLLLKTLNDNEYLMQGSIYDSSFLNIKLFDALGKLIIDYGNFISGDINLSINLKEFKSGIYYLNITGTNTHKTIKLPVK